MTGVRITFAADLAETNLFIARAIAAGTNLRPLMAAIAATLHSATEEAFEDEADPSGAKWAELSELTKERRTERKTWPKKPGILQEYGTLAASVVPSYGDTWAEIGSVLEYAATHQFGRGKIPARPYLGLGPDHEAEIILAATTFFSASL